MRKRWIAFMALIVFATAVFLTALAGPADARQIRIIGCDSLLNWPCPGPVLVDP